MLYIKGFTKSKPKMAAKPHSDDGIIEIPTLKGMARIEFQSVFLAFLLFPFPFFLLFC